MGSGRPVKRDIPEIKRSIECLLYSDEIVAPLYSKSLQHYRNIYEAICNGAKSRAEIRDYTGMSLRRISRLIGKMKKIVPPMENLRVWEIEGILPKLEQILADKEIVALMLQSKLDKLQLIKTAMQEGAYSEEKIAEQTGISKGYVRHLIREIKEGLQPPKGKVPIRTRIAQIKQQVEQGERDIGTIAQKLELSELSVLKYAEQADIGLIYDLRRHKKELRNKMIRRGMSLGQIASRFDSSRQYIEFFIKLTGQQEIWRKSRQHYKKAAKTHKNSKINVKTDKKMLRSILNCMQLRLYVKSQKGTWAEKKAGQYVSTKNRRQKKVIEYSTLVEFFQRYKDAKDRGEKRSLHELCLGLAFCNNSAGRVLKTIGEKPLYGNKNRKILSKEDENLIEKASVVPIPVTDLSYFLEFPEHVINLRFRHTGMRPKPITISKGWKIGSCVTYRLASQIYEARDLEFTIQETAELLDLPTHIVEYAEKQRDKFAPIIISALQVKNPDKKIIKPYKELSLPNFLKQILRTSH